MSDKLERIFYLICELDAEELEEFVEQAPLVIEKMADIQKQEVKEMKVQGEAVTPHCPRCSKDKVRPYGSYRGRKRYRCLSCSSTFNELSGTAVAGTHYPDKWRSFVDCLAVGMSVVKTAEKIEISVPTAFSWRHKLLEKYKKEQTTHLAGITEADETFFLFSEKGNKKVSTHRRPRKRGGKAKTAGISNEQIPVIAGCDRNGNVILGVAGQGRISMADIENVLNNYIGADVTLCTDSHRSFKAYAKAYNLHYIGLNISKGKRVVKKKYHIQNVNNFHSRLKKWMVRFNGVSTKYLQNYMNWFSLLEETKNSSTPQNEAIAKRSLPLV